MEATQELVQLCGSAFLMPGDWIPEGLKQGVQNVLDALDPVTLALASLGRTEKDVAARLRAAGIRGRRQHMRHDPIGRWLTAAGFTSPALFVKHDGSGITVNAGGWVDIPAPPPVVEFVRSFDMGAYHDLAEEA